MKNFKRTICMILCFATMFAMLSFMTSCNGDGENDATDTETESELEKQPDTVYKQDLASYTLVVSSNVSTNLKAIADNLAETLSTSWRADIKVVTDTATEDSEYEILLGNTNRPETAAFKAKVGEGQCGYGVVGRKIVILGSEDAYTEKAANIFLSLVVLATRSAAVKYMDNNLENIVSAEDMISVMSFNLRVGHSTKQGSASKLIKTYMPDLLGVQEADSDWIGALSGRLGKNGYAYVGIGRDSDGKGERTAIFYRTDKFELIDSTTMWLTDTPDTVSKVEGSESRRIVTIAIFKRLSDGKEFAYANTHLDNSTETVREQQVRYLNQNIKSFTDLPHILTGDFNFKKSATGYSVITEEFGYENCSILATHARNRTNATFSSGGVIDYCFRSAGSPFEPYLYAVCTERKNNTIVSDHYPLFLLIDLK